MNQKIAVFIVGAIVLLLVFTALAFHCRQPEKFTDIYNVESSKVKTLLIRDGNTGEAASTSESEKITAFLKLMDKSSFRKQKNPQTMGWSYYVDLYENEEKYVRITFGEGVRVEEIITSGGYYRVNTTSYYSISEDLTGMIENFYGLLAEEVTRTDSGNFAGQIDEDTIQIRISGVPDGYPPRLFQLSENLLKNFNEFNLEQEDEILFQYRDNPGEKPVIIHIEKLINN